MAEFSMDRTDAELWRKRHQVLTLLRGNMVRKWSRDCASPTVVDSERPYSAPVTIGVAAPACAG